MLRPCLSNPVVSTRILPTRNGNRKGCHRPWKPPLTRILPTRNGNNLPDCLPLLRGRQHGSYLQGMETVFIGLGYMWIKNTDPTYKEWKLRSGLSPPHGQPGTRILPTRNGNNILFLSGVSPCELSDTDPTYKEWKLQMNYYALYRWVRI